MKITWNKKEVQRYGLIVAVLGISVGIMGTIFVQRLSEILGGKIIPDPNLIFNWLFCGIAFCTGSVFGAFVTAGMIEILKKKGILK